MNRPINCCNHSFDKPVNRSIDQPINRSDKSIRQPLYHTTAFQHTTHQNSVPTLKHTDTAQHCTVPQHTAQHRKEPNASKIDRTPPSALFLGKHLNNCGSCGVAKRPSVEGIDSTITISNNIATFSVKVTKLLFLVLT